MHIYYYPSFNSQEEFEHHLFRAGWYLPPKFTRQIIFFINDDIKVPSSFDDVPSYLNSGLGKILQELVQNNIIVFKKSNELSLSFDNQNEGSLLVWKSDKETKDQALKLSKSHFLKTYNVSSDQRMESSIYIEIFKDKFYEDYSTQFFHHEKFLSLIEKFKHFDNAVLFLSGPSLNEYDKFEYKHCLKIICNSIIGHDELMAKVKPQIIVFADPIFHFGFSSYAEKFFKDLERALENHPNLTAIIPFKYYSLLSAHYPHLTERVIAVPYTNRNYNYDLEHVFELQGTDNILSFLMIPVATTFCKNIFILGADGRPKKENKYFWKHNDKAQYNKELEDIKKAHPAFFNLSYDDYYDNHIRKLTEIIKDGEKNKYTFFSLTESHIEVINLSYQKYLKENLLAPSTLQVEEKNCLISYNPMLVDNFGHFLNYDLQIFKNLEENEKGFILAHKEYKVEHSFNKIQILPLLPVKQIYHLDDYYLQKRAFLKLLKQFGDERSIIVFAYTGTVFDAYLFLELSEELPHINFKLNLFFYHVDLANNFEHQLRLKLYKQLLDLCKKNLTFYIDSHALLETSFKNTQIQFWPMIHVTPLTSVAAKSHNIRTILVPCTLQLGKGAEILLSVLELIRDSNIKNIRFVVRGKIVGSGNDSARLASVRERMREMPFVEMIEDTLSVEEFGSLFSLADIIFIPYMESDFKTRTSGTLVDAVAFNKPVVTSSRTWLGGEVQRLGIGKTYYSNNPNEIALLLLNMNLKEHDFQLVFLENYASSHLYKLLKEPNLRNIEESKHFYSIHDYFLTKAALYPAKIKISLPMRVINKVKRVLKSFLTSSL